MWLEDLILQKENKNLDEHIVDSVPEVAKTEPDIVVPTSDSEVETSEVKAPEPDNEPVEYQTTLRHFSLDEIKQFTPSKDVIDFGGIKFFITEMSESRMILKPIGSRKKIEKKKVEAVAEAVTA